VIKPGTVMESPQTRERLVIRSTAESSHGDLFQAELTAQRSNYVVRSHLHPTQEERFVVLEGTYGYKIGERTGMAQPGETVVCPIGVPHSQWNAGPGVMRIYYEHRPALESAELFFETYFGLSRDGKLRPSGDMRLLQAAVLLTAVRDFVRIERPPLVVQSLAFPALAAIGRARGYRARYARYASGTPLVEGAR
jgi:mannose-6-phosphate isomerase-like protein (cupin superfamily)